MIVNVKRRLAKMNFEVAKKTINECPFLAAFVCEVSLKPEDIRKYPNKWNPVDKSLYELINHVDGQQTIDTAMQAVCSKSRGLGWKVNQPQIPVAAAAGHLMQLMTMPIEPEIEELAKKKLAEFEASSADGTLPVSTSTGVQETRTPRVEPELNTKVLMDKTRFLYLIEIEDCPVFKFGTYLTD